MGSTISSQPRARSESEEARASMSILEKLPRWFWRGSSPLTVSGKIEQEDTESCPVMMAFSPHGEDVAEAAGTSELDTNQSPYFRQWSESPTWHGEDRAEGSGAVHCPLVLRGSNICAYIAKPWYLLGQFFVPFLSRPHEGLSRPHKMWPQGLMGTNQGSSARVKRTNFGIRHLWL